MDEEGQVRLVGELDRETASTHTVMVKAIDDGEPPRTAIATLMVREDGCEFSAKRLD